MLKSGREEGEQAARADAAYNTASIAAALAPAPELVIVGHGPERPNTGHYDAFNWSSPAYGGFPLPYAVSSFNGYNGYNGSFSSSRRHFILPINIIHQRYWLCPIVPRSRSLRRSA